MHWFIILLIKQASNCTVFVILEMSVDLFYVGYSFDNSVLYDTNHMCI